MVVTNMKELCEYVLISVKLVHISTLKLLESMERVEVWVIEDTNYRKNLRFLNNIKRHIIKYGDNR